MPETINYTMHPVGYIQSDLKKREDAPKQGHEGAPDVWLEIDDQFREGLEGIETGQELILITWFHQSDRSVLKVHPRGNKNNPITGVFGTRSPDRPNPLGLHRVTVLQILDNKLKIGPLEAIDGTPVVDIKPVLPGRQDF